ncbi:UDP-2,4-diacetamido-2,4,6-trideoxy-beta-L-altropyranose hydrolase [Halanaerobium saccharolyticum]|uniref:UDP-2,4-diacetamido-2,4, 6-trideoxy-beta-L-altropyranose hydrolase n=1 Tax=Halanaerobium saccharolyticum TaxID=43595 RepID=A0A4R7Z501_9FIRM|nr:UDP-2,4-diacetamido-2,4,6-trideoxy-beta-L-altropyranose hydrolase [Halanaerobium saccharolyticum]RAK12630.1 UDP-2,4-diacetamido-2,4,6-trideoxy-beta-L-altropyranose hydrolase [Halanaerobium saccharolyticum]TDW05458.1 UDP-2,4-diacetamido-2,4,6-trideoxy-beta-L-altropyranose hydrolase [Halanaerobium saccharolyticum]TDX62973.1 UDP-2,4-diacetamido-2,4,6-trideoxy-beta-L-altropyranose hydrolase [Halanaerobium saccharolyticum]
MIMALRVDGGKDIGMGHIMRSMTLADDLKKDEEVERVFYITKNEPSAVKKLKENDFEVITIDKDLNYNEEIKEVKEIIKKEKVNKLITDSYDIDQNYLIEMRKVVDKLVTIHDYAPFAFPSHVVINGNAYADDLDYESLYGDTEFRLGTDYLLLREEFRNLPEIEVRDRVQNILVTVGGYDLRNLTPKIIEALNSIDFDEIEDQYIDKENLHIDVVIGPSFDNVDHIVAKVVKCNLDISLNFNVKKMSKLMLKSDIAISSGGSTLYELAATKTPALVLLQAENQVRVADKLDDKSIINLGFENKNIRFGFKEILEKRINLVDGISIDNNFKTIELLEK